MPRKNPRPAAKKALAAKKRRVINRTRRPCGYFDIEARDAFGNPVILFALGASVIAIPVNQ